MKEWQNKLLQFVCWASLAISLVMLYLFIWHKKDFSTCYAVNTSEVGQYGDFVGGVVGTILSVSLLYFTLYLQRKDSTNNSKIYKGQQLNDEFFHLMEVYYDILKNFGVEENETFYIGKLAVHKNVEEMYSGFDHDGNLSQSRKKAVLAYQDFYSRERNFAPVYFRTLYRICQIVDESDCSEEKKVEYIKILRAQLTDSELILLRYNAMTPLGHNFIKYINKYNLLKHIPTFMLLEYKIWRRELSESTGTYVFTNLLQIMKEAMANMLKGETSAMEYRRNGEKNKYRIKITCSECKDEIRLYLKREKERDNITDVFVNLNCFPRTELTNLLRYYMKDCFVLNTFNQLNRRKDLEIDYESEDIKGVEVIEVWVKNKKGMPLKLTNIV